MEITDTLAAKSDQQNAIDFTTGPRTFVVKSCRVTGGDQPVSIDLVGEDGRPYKPSKNMRRVIANGWGPRKEDYAGRSLTLYRDPNVMFSGQKLGGIKVSHMSHIDKPITTDITEKRQPVKHTVQPLTEAPAPVESPAAKAVTAFKGLGVGEDVLVAKFGGRAPDQWSDADLAVLLTIFQSIQSGATTAADEFGGE